MTLRIFVCVLILVIVTACDRAPQTFAVSQDLQKQALGIDTLEPSGAEGNATIDLSVKFDKTPYKGFSNVGVAYFRVDISNPSNYRLSIGAVHLQFKDEMEISIQNCRLEGPDIRPYGNTHIQVKPGEVFSASDSCLLPISQMDLVEKVVSRVDFDFIEE